MLQLRGRILSIVPDAEEVISYGMPAFRVGGTIVAGLLANKTYVGYYPFSGTVLPALPEALASFRQTKSALHVPLDRTLSLTLIRTLIRLRLAQARPTSRAARAPGASAPRHRRESARVSKSG
jgi:uncharacterized protein YdhG (YjbR/CyaY superfamily)